MDTRASIKWIKTAVFAALGGGVTASVGALADPTKYRFPQDLGTGKMWPYFLTGISVALGGVFLHSEWGRKLMGAYSDAERQAEIDRKELEALKAKFKPPDKT